MNRQDINNRKKFSRSSTVDTLNLGKTEKNRSRPWVRGFSWFHSSKVILLVVSDKVTICPHKNFHLGPPEQSSTGTCVQKFQKAMELVPLFPGKIGKSISSLGSSDPLVLLVGNILKDIGRDTDVLPVTKILKPNEVTCSEKKFPGKIAKPISSLGSSDHSVSLVGNFLKCVG